MKISDPLLMKNIHSAREMKVKIRICTQANYSIKTTCWNCENEELCFGLVWCLSSLDHIMYRISVEKLTSSVASHYFMDRLSFRAINIDLVIAFGIIGGAQKSGVCFISNNNGQRIWHTSFLDNSLDRQRERIEITINSWEGKEF